ncbi:retrotransposon hot spot (RHS) protein [Trypanosoma cruzi]|nr:retrotransposon hot spot (RHS) protein [Trypanosoma cruzi]
MIGELPGMRESLCLALSQYYCIACFPLLCSKAHHEQKHLSGMDEGQGLLEKWRAPCDRMGRGAASWVDGDPLPRVSLWVIACSVCVVCWLRGCGRVPLAVGLNWRRWRCVRLLCGGPNPLTRGLTALRWCRVCV